MAGALAAAGLAEQGEHLAAFARGETGPSTAASGRRLFRTRKLPDGAQDGDAWFDPLELTTMILVPAGPDASPDVSGWVSTRPCALWQMRAFMRVGKARGGSPPKRYLDWTRFDDAPGRAPVTSVWHDEAIAYAHWFGKTLTGRFSLEAAAAFLSAEELEVAFPAAIGLWDAAEPAEGEREVVRREELGRDDAEDDDADPPPGLGEWARQTDIGFSTFVRRRTGLMTDPERRTYFFHLDGVAAR